jgi:hypothetical protein
MQPRIGDEHDQGGEESKSLRGSGHQNQYEHGQGQWTYQPLPFDIYITVYAVRKYLLSNDW